jgi:hypothetical protein
MALNSLSPSSLNNKKTPTLSRGVGHPNSSATLPSRSLPKTINRHNDNNHPTNDSEISLSYKGVTFHKRTGKYMAQLYVNSKKYHLGQYILQSDAAYAYDLGAHELNGPGQTRAQNFAKVDDYARAREEELEFTGFGSNKVGSVDDAKKKIMKRILELQQCPPQQRPRKRKKKENEST